VYTQLREWHVVHGLELQILLFPSDEFGGQELPSEQVAPFVQKQGLPTDGGGCHLMGKVQVNGPKADAAWKLAKEAFPGDVPWNFAGIFVFDKAGVPVGRFTARELSKVDETLSGLLAPPKL